MNCLNWIKLVQKDLNWNGVLTVSVSIVSVKNIILNGPKMDFATENMNKDPAHMDIGKSAMI